MDILLIAGLWLPASEWDNVAAELERLGHRARPVRLPGVDDRSTSATLDDQLAAVLAAVDAADRPVVVGHSASSTLAWMAGDRRPDSVRAVVLLGGFPSPHGETYADFFPIDNGVMAFPGWEPFEGPDSADLGPDQRDRLARLAVDTPEGVAAATVTLADDRRFDLPVVLICPEFSPDDARAWIGRGDLPEMARMKHLTMVDLDSGHWPMVSRPAELARRLDAAAGAEAP